MFVTWQSEHGHDSTEFTIIMANHNFATEVIDLRKIKAQPDNSGRGGVGRRWFRKISRHSQSQHSGSGRTKRQLAPEPVVTKSKSEEDNGEEERSTDASRICKGQTLWQRNGYRAVRANVTTINRKPMHSRSQPPTNCLAIATQKQSQGRTEMQKYARQVNQRPLGEILLRRKRRSEL
jgi:hypothetical protein